MNRNIILSALIISMLFFGKTDLYAQTVGEGVRTIYFMRAKQFYGSGAKMNLMINDELFYKIKNGTRLILKASAVDTLNIQIVYPLIKSRKSEILHILPDAENEIFIDLLYEGEGYNPVKHTGVLKPHGGLPAFSIEIIQMDKKEGSEKFNQTANFKDNNKIPEKRFP